MAEDPIGNLYCEDIVETIRQPLLVLDSELMILSANRNFYDTFKATPEKTLGRPVYDLDSRYLITMREERPREWCRVPVVFL